VPAANGTSPAWLARTRRSARIVARIERAVEARHVAPVVLGPVLDAQALLGAALRWR